MSEDLTVGQKFIVFSFLSAAAVVGVYAWWTHEPEPEDYCANLREVFAEKVEAQDIEGAIDAPASIVVVDTPDAEDGLPCDISLEAVR